MVEQLLDAGELASRLGVKVKTVYVWIGQGRLPVVKLGRRSIFVPSAIDKWLASRAQRALTPRERRRFEGSDASMTLASEGGEK